MGLEEVQAAIRLIDENASIERVLLPGHKPITMIVFYEEWWKDLKEVAEIDGT